MSNAAAPKIAQDIGKQNAGNLVDRRSRSAPSIGFPPAEDNLPGGKPLSVLARIPNLAADSPAQDEAHQYRVDSTLVPPTQPHLVPNQPIDKPPSQLAVDARSEHGQAHSDIDPVDKFGVGKTNFTSSDAAATCEQIELSTAEHRISEILLWLKVTLKPFARFILLTTLLTASALAYLLMEDNRAGLTPHHQEHPIPTFSEEPQLTITPPSASPSLQPAAQPILIPDLPLSAIGPGGNQAVVSKNATPSGMKSQAPSQPIAISSPLPKKPTPAAKSSNPDGLIFRAPVTAMEQTESQKSPTLNVPASYPDTGHPDVTILPISRKGASLIEQDRRLPAMAELTGSIQPPLKR